MQAVTVTPSKREVKLVDQPAPELDADHQVKIRSLEVGICGTDREICSFAYGAPPPGSDSFILGHESLGEVVEVGAKVAALKAGDLVVPTVRRPCSDPACRPCRAGRPDFCVTGNFTERGIKMRDGYMTEFYVEQDAYLTRIPSQLRDVAVLVEPLTVAEKALDQLWLMQKRLPWASSSDQPGAGLRAVVLGAGPVGILGAMAFITRGFKTFVYSRSPKPNPKAELVEAIGAQYISAKQETVEQLAERVGSIDVVYEAVGHAQVVFDFLRVLGINGLFICTGIPAPKQAIPVEADKIMRNMVLKNQVLLGTVNASLEDFRNAARDLEVFSRRWPAPLRRVITGRYRIDQYRQLLLEHEGGIKNVIALA